MGRTRPHNLALIVSLLVVLALAGCGGNQISADEVTAEPPALPLPAGGTTASTSLRESAGAAEDEEGSEDEDEDAAADATATPTPGAAAGGGTTPPAATATPAPTTGGAAPQPEPENTGGAQADEGLDQFCADNPGAC